MASTSTSAINYGPPFDRSLDTIYEDELCSPLDRTQATVRSNKRSFLLSDSDSSDSGDIIPADTTSHSERALENSRSSCTPLFDVISDYRSLFATPSDQFRKCAPLMGSIIGVEGIICAGKSHLLKVLSNKKETPAEFLFETPLNALLALFYKDRSRYAFAMQMDMLRLRQRTQDDSLALSGRPNRAGCSKPGARIVWNDRTMWGDIVFGKLNHSLGNMTDVEFDVYMSAVRDIGNYTYDYILFLDVCAERAWDLNQNHRKNKSEEGIPLSYFQDLRKMYYIVFRHLALECKSRLVMIKNEPFASADFVINVLLKTPSPEVIRDRVFVSSPEITISSPPEEVSQAYAYVHRMYSTIL